MNYAGLIPVLIEAMKEMDILCGRTRCELRAADDMHEKYDMLAARYDQLNKEFTIWETDVLSVFSAAV